MFKVKNYKYITLLVHILLKKQIQISNHIIPAEDK